MFKCEHVATQSSDLKNHVQTELEVIIQSLKYTSKINIYIYVCDYFGLTAKNLMKETITDKNPY